MTNDSDATSGSSNVEFSDNPKQIRSKRVLSDSEQGTSPHGCNNGTMIFIIKNCRGLHIWHWGNTGPNDVEIPSKEAKDCIRLQGTVYSFSPDSGRGDRLQEKKVFR